MKEYRPNCEQCPHLKSCTIQKELTMLYQERFNRSRELAGRTDGFVDGKYVKDAIEPQTDWHYDEQDSTWYPYKHEDEPKTEPLVKDSPSIVKDLVNEQTDAKGADND